MIRSRDIDNQRFVFTKKQSIILLAHYFIGYYFVYSVVAAGISMALYPDIQGLHPKVMMGQVLFMIISTVWIVKDPLKRSWRFFKANLKENIASVFKSMFLLFLGNIVINVMIIYVLKVEMLPENQEIVESMIKSAALPMFLATVVFAPLVEEIIFRGVLYQNLRSKTRFYLPMILSTLIFASMHLVAGFVVGRGWTEFIFIFQYGLISLFMIRSMEETGTIVGAIGVHFLNNLLAYSVTLASFIMFF
ncbi:MAG TPA: type II CAAX endopeptidase family protein [Erysipelothrix sp.]|nr:type II CAAX endopeptidase family protein [Erysipelothrix sp.]